MKFTFNLDADTILGLHNNSGMTVEEITDTIQLRMNIDLQKIIRNIISPPQNIETILPSFIKEKGEYLDVKFDEQGNEWKYFGDGWVKKGQRPSWSEEMLSSMTQCKEKIQSYKDQIEFLTGQGMLYIPEDTLIKNKEVIEKFNKNIESLEKWMAPTIECHKWATGKDFPE